MTLGLISLAACSGKKKKDDDFGAAEKPEAADTANKTGKNAKGWDYGKIREVRAAEAAEQPADVDTRTEEADCRYLSKAQMIRAKATGCRPVDSSAGHGEDTFCCPK